MAVSRLLRRSFLFSVVVLTVTGCARSDPWQPVAPTTAEAVLRQAVNTANRPALLAGIRPTAAWLHTSTAADRFPINSIQRDRARLSLLAFLVIVGSTPATDLATNLHSEFQLYEANSPSPSLTRGGPVLYTGYYAPTFRGSLTPDDSHPHPLYALPTDPTIATRTRSQLEGSGLLKGLELVWLTDPWDAYTVQVNGSARIMLPDGSHINLGHRATNGRPYTSLGRVLIEEGRVDPAQMSMQRLRAFFADHPDEFQGYAWRNERYVFFEPLPDDGWPRASTGLTLQPWASMATDHRVVPPGCLAIVQTTVSSPGGVDQPPEAFTGFVLNHDTGGAIKGAGRVDLFMGVGSTAGEIAGRQAAPGRLFILLLRDDRLDHWRTRLGEMP